jgi:O-antigen/teichoic acid export membrane protein
VLPLLYGKKFIPSIIMVQAILPGILMMVVSKTLTSFFSGSGKPYVLLVSCSISLVTNIVLNFILIPLYGGVGAAFATNISYTILAIILLTVFATSTKIPLKEMITYSREDFKVLRRIKNRILKF